MANLLDSIMVELGLDVSGFTRRSAEALRAMEKSRDEAKKNSQEIARTVGDGMGDALKKATLRAVEFFGVLAGASSVAQFTASVTSGNVQLGIMAAQLGMTPQRISMIQMAVVQAGGSAEAAAQSLKNLNDLRNRVLVGGEAPPVSLQRIGVGVRDSSSPEDLLNRIVERLSTSRVYTNENERINVLTQLGVDPATAAFWVRRGVAGAQRSIDAIAADAVSPAQVTASQELNAAWAGARQSVVALGREIVRVVSPAVTRLLGYVRELIERNREVVAGWFGDRVKEAVDWVSNPDTWREAKKTFDDLYDKLKTVTDAVGGWANMSKVVLGLWAMDNVLPALAAISVLAGAFGTLWGSMAPVITALAVGGVIAMFKNGPRATSDEGARARIDLSRRLHQGDPSWVAPSVEQQRAFDALPWYLKMISDPLSSAAYTSLKNSGMNVLDVNRDRDLTLQRGRAYESPISTSEGPVGEARPLPVKIVGASGAPTPVGASSAPAPAPEAQDDSLWGKTKRFFGFGSPSRDAPPPSNPSSPPATHVMPPATRRPSTGAFGGAQSVDPKQPFYVPPGTPISPSSSLGYARYALGTSPTVHRPTSSVVIGAMNVNHSSPGGRQGPDVTARLKADFYALSTDVGLA